MSKRQFEEWSLGAPKKTKKYKTVKVKGKSIFVGKYPLVTFADGVSPSDRRYYESLLLEGAMAVKKNEYAKIYRFYDEKEARQFNLFYRREIGKIRAKK